MTIHLSDILAPHYCSSCGEVGGVLCDYCKYDIIEDRYAQCVVCLAPRTPSQNLCSTCRPAYGKAWCVGARHEGLRALIDHYKFDRRRAVSRALVELLDETLPELPDDLLVVPVPTIMKHIRQRGYGHTERVAAQFAAHRRLEYLPALRRQTNHVQHGASRATRLTQAKQAFRATSQLDDRRCLLVDDVYTTGATMEYAARALKAAGAREVWIAVVSRQPLEK